MDVRQVALALLAALVGAAAAAAEPPTGTSLGLPTPPPPPPALQLLAPLIGITGDPVLGAADAPVTIVEFTDYQCPFCQGYAQDTFPRLKAAYIDSGKVRYVARDFPLSNHARARPAAVAAACAREQGRFWEMHEALLGHAGQLADEDFRAHAKSLGLDAAAFEACRANGAHLARLDADVAAARAIGVRGTPTFLVGASRGDVAQGRLLQGDETYDDFVKVLEKYLPAE
jgi:protein-disulfide isomerase